MYQKFLGDKLEQQEQRKAWRGWLPTVAARLKRLKEVQAPSSRRKGRRRKTRRRRQRACICEQVLVIGFTGLVFGNKKPQYLLQCLIQVKKEKKSKKPTLKEAESSAMMVMA